MLGKKCSLAPLKEELRTQGVSAQRTSTAFHLASVSGSVAEAEPETNITLWNRSGLIHPEIS